MKVLVTGSRGMIGRQLVKRLKELEIEFYELEGDVRDFKNFKNVKAEAVVHLAAKTFVPDSFDNPKEFYEVNILGTLNALELCRLNKAKMIFISSYVYGNPKYLPIDEKHPIEPHSPYNESKLLGERLCEFYNKNFKTRCVIFRQFNVYGPGQKKFLIGSVIEQLKKREIVLQSSEPRRDFTFVTDVVEAYIKALSYDCEFEIFNLGYGKSYSVKEVAQKIIKISKSKAKLKFTGKKRENEIMDTVADISKIKHKLGWEPKVDLDNGIKKVLGIGNA